MLNAREHPVAWAMLMYELADAHEHLGTLLEQMKAEEIDDTEYAIHLGHIFAHLNRAWHGRNDPNLEEESDETAKGRSAFPSDLTPTGFGL